MSRRALVPALASTLVLGLGAALLVGLPADAAPAAEVESVVVDLTAAPQNVDLPAAAEAEQAEATDAEATDAEAPDAEAEQAAAPDAAPEVGFARQQITEPVAIAAVTVPAGADPGQVFVRTVENGQATDWEEVDIDEVGPDDKAASTVPVIVSGADAVEVAAVEPSEPATLQVFSSTVTKSDTAASDYAWSNPQILSRKAWQADESLVRQAYTVGSVTGAMIHHTAGTNDYTATEVPALLRAIQRYHVEGRGWNDIAYNVLVDKYGRAWEGRGGGLTKAIAGGHAYGETNKRVFGISLMGNYEEAQPSAAMLETMDQVIAWKFALHGVDPTASTWGSGGQDGGSTYLPAISGHRDENATLCPGKYVYAKFPEIRARVAQIMEGKVSGLATSTPKPTASSTPKPTASSTPAPTASSTPAPTASSTPRPTASSTPAPATASPTPTTPLSALQFSDVPAGTPHEEHIAWLAAKKISTGYEDGTFRPTQAVNRDAMAAFMYRLAGSPAFEPAGRQSFIDVTPTAQFYKEIEWLAATGISTGWETASGQEFRPVDPVSRDAMAAFLYRLYGSPAHATPATAPFLDVPVGTQFDKEIDWLAASGISTGWAVSGGAEFRPSESVNRDAMAAFMHRAFDTYGTPKLTSAV